MKLNPIEWINELVDGLVYLVLGYLAACGATLLRPVRGPLSLQHDAVRPDAAKLTSTVVLFLSALLTSACIAWAGYSKLMGEATRMASNGARAGDYRLLVVAIVAVAIFAACDLAARTPSLGASRRRVGRARRLAVRHYQIATALALACALFALRQFSQPWLPGAREPGAWIRFHQWSISLAPVALVLVWSILARLRRGRRAARRERWRSVVFFAPAVAVWGLAFYALSDLPQAGRLRRPQQALSQALLNNISDRYPTATYSQCTFRAPDQLEVASAILNRGKYSALLDLGSAQVGIAQGWLPGYGDTEVAWFVHPVAFGVQGQSADTTRLVLVKPGEAVVVTARFQSAKAYQRAWGKYEQWRSEAREELDYPYLSEPYCYLGLRMHNLDLETSDRVPNFDTNKDYWREFRRTASGEILIAKPVAVSSGFSPGPKPANSAGRRH